MKKLVAIVLSLMALPMYALNVECVGTALQTVQGFDTVFVFAGEPHLRSTIGKLDWYRTSDRELIQSDTEEVYPESGEGVIVKRGTEFIGVYYVFELPKYKPVIASVDVTPRCRETLLQLQGTIPPMAYTDTFGLPAEVERQCKVSCMNLAWDNEAWSDSAASQSFQLSANKMHLPALYGTTSYTVSFDHEWREALSLPADTVASDDVEPIAVSSHVVSTTTIRGEKGAKSNEVDRPTDATALTGSAPLEIYFESNPTPAVRFYDWRIYRGSELIATRLDEAVRYTFSNPGQYRVVSYVLGDKCPCNADDGDCERDSTVINISVPESQLLVPNVFTPNGDGQNDEFRVLYRSLREYHIWVYNRWGKLVYESTDPSKGWDGMIGNRPAAEGAYYYVIRALGTDAATDAGYRTKQSHDRAKANGDESVLGVYQLSGDINLLRGKDK